jgi:hypothetical protein
MLPEQRPGQRYKLPNFIERKGRKSKTKHCKRKAVDLSDGMEALISKILLKEQKEAHKVSGWHRSTDLFMHNV